MPNMMPPPMIPNTMMPINIPTQGPPIVMRDDYQQVGILTRANGSEMILPLMGQSLYTNRDKWNYYTRTDGMNPVQVPVEFQRRKCDDDTGCQEITEGDSVAVPILGQSYVASVYRYSTPRYIPV